MSAVAAADNANGAIPKRPFRIRTITVFVNDLSADDFVVGGALAPKINNANAILRRLETSLADAGYEVQTVRLVTNPFAEWLTTPTSKGDDDDDDETGAPIRKKAKADEDGTIDTLRGRLLHLDNLLESNGINFCSLGPSTTPEDTAEVCPAIVASSGRFSCSANVDAGDVESARAAARCIGAISTLDGVGFDGTNDHVRDGLGNFRFCASSSVVGAVPFFPGARTPTATEEGGGGGGVGGSYGFAIGLENGAFARELLEEAKCVGDIRGACHGKMRDELMRVQSICEVVSGGDVDCPPSDYLGIDASLNPSLDDGGSVAEGIECLDEVRGVFGGTGSLAAAAAITTSLQSTPGIKCTGYSGLMLPVLEDRRLAELGTSTSSSDRLTIQKLLMISAVCGVGIDTVPIPGDVTEDSLSSLILDVSALACRWSKPLSCRVFPVPGGKAGDETTFDSPYMCNSCIFKL